MPVRMADFRPELANHMRPGVNRDQNAPGGSAACHRVLTGGHPQARDEAAAKGAGNSAQRNGSLSGGGFACHHRTQQRVLHSRAEAFLAGAMIGQLLVSNPSHAELDSVFYNVYADRRTKTFSEC